MTNEIVLSPVKDSDMSKNLGASPVWKSAYHVDEVTDEVRKKFPHWFEYHLKFEGLKPIQLTNFKVLS
jgi:hypothetical protein